MPASRLEDIAASEVINNFYNIHHIVKKDRHLLCYCQYQYNFKCAACIISSYFPNWYKSVAIRNLKYLVNKYKRIIELKTELIKKAAYKVIFFEEEYEYVFFASKLPKVKLFYNSPTEMKF